MSRDELLDWLALWSIDPWGPGRADRIAAVHSLWARGTSFEDIGIEYPYVVNAEDEEEEVLALLDKDRERRTQDGSQARTAEP